MSNPTGKGGFKERPQHINRKGRPKSFDALRALAQMIATEKVEGREGTAMSRVEIILRRWSLSDNPQLAGRFMEIAYGKVPDEVKAEGLVKVLVDYADDPYPLQQPPSGATGGDTEQTQV